MKIAIFDFDGTVADTMELGIKLFNEVAEKYNLPKLKNKDVKKLRGMGAGEVIKLYSLSPVKLAKLAIELQSKMKKQIANIKSVDGMLELFGKLRNKNIKIGIVTSNTAENVKLFLQQNKMEVDFVHGEKSLFGKGKVLKKLIKRLSLLRDEVVYVGDEVRDIEAARKAGIKIIAVTWGFNSRERLERAKPDFVIDRPREIIDLI